MPVQGCFWGVEQKFLQRFKDAVQTTVGYTGGNTQEPTYMQVSHFAGIVHTLKSAVASLLCDNLCAAGVQGRHGAR